MDDRPDVLRAQLAAIVDSSDDAIVSKTLDGVIVSWNRGAQELFGYSAEEAVGQHIFLIVPDDRRDEEQEVIARVRRGEKVDHFETVRRTKNGRSIAISLTVSPVRDASGRIVGASKVARDVTDRIAVREGRRQAREELERRVSERTAELVEANEALRQEIALRQRAEHDRERLFTRLVLAQEDERRRIARELHDQLGQQITALRMTLATLGEFATARPELRSQIEALQDLAKQLDQDVAFRVWELRPAALDVLGLAAALAEYAGNWSKRSGIRTELHVARPTGSRLTPEMETTMYRFAQEALNNVAKHARADRVDIVLEYIDDHASLIVEDNGSGFDPSLLQTPAHGFGLMGMRERAALAGAEFRIESSPGQGTTVILRVPTTAPVIKTT